MPRAVGLDLGSRTLKVVEISGSAKSFKVQRVVVKEIPEGAEATDEARAGLVREAFSEGRFPKDDVCAAFDAGSAIFREIMVPFREDDQIEKVVRFEAENHLHGRAIEDVVVNWVKLGDTKEGSQLLIFAAPKAALGESLGVLRRAGVEPASMDLDATALYTACHATGVFAEHPDAIVLEVGARTTNLLVVAGGRLRAVRSFLVGTDSVATGLQHDLSLPPGEAQKHAMRGGNEGDLLVPAASASPGASEARKSVAELERDAATSRREELVRKLAREINRTVTSTHGAQSPDRLLLAGGGSLLPGLAASLKESLGIEVQPLAILGRLGWRSGAANPVLEEAVSPVALGCALRLLGADPLGVELRREEYAPSNLFDVVRTSLAVAVTLLVVVLAAVGWNLRESGDRERSRFIDGVCSKALGIYVEVEKRYQQEVKNKSEGEAKTLADKSRLSIASDENFLYTVRNLLLRRHQELEKDLGLSKDVPPIESALKVWKELYTSFDSLPRAELGYLRINRMTISQSSAQITIEIDNESNLDRLEKALATNEYLRGRAKNTAKPVTRNTFTRNAATKNLNGSFEIFFAEVG